MPPLHPLVVHFPIALYLVSVLFDIIMKFRFKSSLNDATRILLFLSWISSGVAVLTGDGLKDEKAAFLPHRLVGLHESLAIAFSAWLTLLLLVRLRKRYQPSWSYLALAGVGTVLLILVGHTGGSMVWPSAPTTAMNTQTGWTSDARQQSGSQTPANEANGGAEGRGDTARNQKGTASQPSSAKPAPSSAQTNNSSATHANNGGASSHNSTNSSPPPSPNQQSSVNQVLYQQGSQFFVQDCQSCHSLGVTEQYYGQLTAAEWQHIVQNMQWRAGGAITNTQAAAITYYLEHHP